MVRILTRDDGPTIHPASKAVVDAQLREARGIVKDINAGLFDSKGRTLSRDARRIGEIPAALYFADQEWFDTPGNCEKWLKENHKLRVGRENL